MELDHVTFVGPPIDDREILAKILANLAGLLEQLTGFIQFHGGLLVWGACRQPSCHSLRDAWFGAHAFHNLYPAIHLKYIPFAEDCLGDQFILRDERVLRLLIAPILLAPRPIASLHLGPASTSHAMEWLDSPPQVSHYWDRLTCAWDKS
jgi:hypothetical protein